ncbi:hypothetical protein ACIQC9_11090 [Brevundimonas sp. NPDC092305]|uniref:hypothetical protein n=1 Tax=Brevundimonas sp. NPDC092305 TaxID=3363957 RepID=UPI0038229CB5
MGKHFNSKHEDGTWRALFGRWHAGEDARALRREAGVSGDTWQANAKRLGMRIRDLPDGHPAKRGAPPHAERADDWKHPKSLLNEGEWRALFALRAEGVPDTALCARFGVAAATICSQAKVRGIRREDIREVVKRAESPAAPAVETAAVPLSGVEIVMGDPGRTMAAFDGAIAEAGRRADYVTVTTACRAKLSVRRAMFGEGGGVASSRPHPVAPDQVGDDHPPRGGEGEPADWADPVLRGSQTPPEGDWTTWLFLGGRGAGKTLAGAMWLSDQAEALGPGGRLALIGPTLHDVREVMIEGASGG